MVLSGLSLHSQTRNIKTNYVRNFKETITPIELNHGEMLRYTGKDGSVLTIELLSTSANILYTNRDKIPYEESGNDLGSMYRARLMYEFNCDVRINGFPMTMRRYVCSQESFYEPYVINGIRIWFDGVTDIFEEHGGFLDRVRSANGKPGKNARFLLQDMTHRICPDEIHAWFIDGEDRDDNFIYKDNFIDIGRPYNGDDCFLGAYMGGQSHGALDMDMAQNSLMYAPFDLDTQTGIRAEGSKTWLDGSQWRINTGHVMEKYVPDNTPVKGGEVYGRGARRGTALHTHAHFGFQIYENGILYDVDPWIIFWQLFEDNKKRDGVLRAMMAPLSHSKTGAKIKFQSICSLEENQCSLLEYYWTFGDGGWSTGSAPEYVYVHPGIYPVTLTIDNGKELASFTQHITIEGADIKSPSLILSSGEEPFFRPRPTEAMDVYGWPVKLIPHTMEFLARASRPEPKTRKLHVNNLGSGGLGSATYGIDYRNNRHIGWLNIQSAGQGNDQVLDIGVNSEGFPPGEYVAIVAVHSAGALNSPQKFRVVMNVPQKPARSAGVIIDDKDDEFYCTPYFWVGHRFHGWGWPELKNAEGYNHFYLINGQRAKESEFARFTPDLEAGIYDVWLYEKTPYASGPPANNEPAKFQVRIAHAGGDTVVWMEPTIMKGFFPRPHKDQDGWTWLDEPQPTRKIGTFRFDEGKDGFVEIWSKGSTGQVIVDAIRFLKRNPTIDAVTKVHMDKILSKISEPEVLATKLRDEDGNLYTLVKIGTQVWMSENLKTTKYNNGTPIPMVTDPIVWSNLMTPAYCWYENNEATYKNTYGALYNWYAVNKGNLCPIGWNVPTDAEWTTLTNYLGGSELAHHKIREVGIEHWTNLGAEGGRYIFNNYTGLTNETGFTALPGGDRYYNGKFRFIRIVGNWWSSTESDSTHAWNRSITFNRSTVYRRNYYGRYGFSVRCIKD